MIASPYPLGMPILYPPDGDRREARRPSALVRWQQSGKRANQITFDGALEVARSIPLVGPSSSRKLPSFTRYSEQEGARRGIQYALLHLPELDLQHLIEFIAL